MRRRRATFWRRTGLRGGPQVREPVSRPSRNLVRLLAQGLLAGRARRLSQRPGRGRALLPAWSRRWARVRRPRVHRQAGPGDLERAGSARACAPAPAPKERGERPRRLHRASEARVAKAAALAGSAFLIDGNQNLEPIPAPSERRVEARRSGDAAADRRRVLPGDQAWTPGPSALLPARAATGPDLGTARVTVSINVGTSGKVTNVSVAPPLPTGALESCLKSAVSRWEFPPSPTDYETQVPLALSGR